MLSVITAVRPCAGLGACVFGRGFERAFGRAEVDVGEDELNGGQCEGVVGVWHKGFVHPAERAAPWECNILDGDRARFRQTCAKGVPVIVKGDTGVVRGCERKDGLVWVAA